MRICQNGVYGKRQAVWKEIKILNNPNIYSNWLDVKIKPFFMIEVEEKQIYKEYLKKIFHHSVIKIKTLRYSSEVLWNADKCKNLKKISEFVIKLKNPRYRIVERQKNESSSTHCKKIAKFFREILIFQKNVVYLHLWVRENNKKECTLTYWILDTYRRKKLKRYQISNRRIGYWRFQPLSFNSVAGFRFSTRFCLAPRITLHQKDI